MLSRGLVQYGLRRSRVRLSDNRETHRKCIYSCHVNNMADVESNNYAITQMPFDATNSHFDINTTSSVFSSKEIGKRKSNIKTRTENLQNCQFMDMKVNLKSPKRNAVDIKMRCLLHVQNKENLTINICKFSSSACLSEKSKSDIDFQGNMTILEDSCKTDELCVTNCDKERKTSIFIPDKKLDNLPVHQGQTKTGEVQLKEDDPQSIFIPDKKLDNLQVHQEQTKTGEVQLKEDDPQSLVPEKNKNQSLVLSHQDETNIITSDSNSEPKSAIQMLENENPPSEVQTFVSDTFSQVLVQTEPNVSVSKTDDIPKALSEKNDGQLSKAEVESEEQKKATDSSLVNNKTDGYIKKNRKKNKLARKLKSDVSVEKKDTLPVESYSLSPYVDHSDTLKQLVMLGVDLSKIERKKTIANYILRLDFERHVNPVLYFFKDIGIKNENLATIITKNPYVLSNSNLEVIVQYLRSKKFEEESIQRLIVKCPAFLSMDVKEIDEMLGFYQKEFKLSGNEVRKVITQQPKLIGWDQEKFKVIKHHMKELLGFSEGEMKTIFLIQPFVYLSDKRDLVKKFDFLHNHMGLTHEQMVQWPFILRSRLSRIKSRHKYLVHLGRNQYNGKLEKYVSLRALVAQSDEEWCRDVTKTEVKDYYNFLKTI